MSCLINIHNNQITFLCELTFLARCKRIRHLSKIDLPAPNRILATLNKKLGKFTAKT